MKRATPLLFLISLFLFSCSSSPQEDPAAISRKASFQEANQCVDGGDLNCAQKKYCELRATDESDLPSGLRCCVSMFLNSYFSDNTRELSKMLGYQPGSFTELKQSSLEDLLSQKKLPFGELIFLSSEKAPSLNDVLTGYAKNLVSLNASSSLLNQRMKTLGEDLEGVSRCLGKIGDQWNGEADLEPRFFGGGNETVKVTSREIRFLQFATAGLSYLSQSVFEYEWGFETFPTWPPADSFYQDINGHLGAGDLRFGDLDETGARAIVSHGPLLTETFRDLDLFMNAGGAPAPIDQWLSWRFTSDSLIHHREFLKAAQNSLASGQWTPIPQSEDSVNLSALLDASTLPNAARISPGIDLLVKDENQNPTVNLTYLTELLKTLVAKK